MGFNFGFGKKKKLENTIRTYVAERAKEKRAFEKQLDRLETQLMNKTLDLLTYQRMMDALEINYIRQREEALAYMQNTFLKSLPI